MSIYNDSYEVKMRKVFDFLSSVNQAAYKDTFLLSNQVLSKNPFTNNFIHRFLSGNGIKHSPAITLIFLKLFKYYVRSFKKFISYLAEFIIYSFSHLNFTHLSKCNELILIDTFFVIKNIKDSNKFIDSCFPGLKSLLDKLSYHYAYLPVFIGSRKFIRLTSILKILKNEKAPVLSEYQLLSISDLLHLIYFILAYPFHVLKFFNSVNNDSYESVLLRSELIDTLDLVTFDSFSRYLQGRKIAKLPYDSIKVISWYENQVIDKNLYKGLREANSKVKIYGAQLFLYSKAILNIIPDENEGIFGILPDKVIVNGSAFVPKDTRLNYIIGPSLRYSKIFGFSSQKENRMSILTLLPYFKEDTENILRMLCNLHNFQKQIFIKKHPSISIDKIKSLLPKNTVIVNDDIYKLFETTKIVIGSASGTLVEATSLGIPAVVIKNSQGFNCNYLPDYGKGIIWEEASSAEELERHLYKFDRELENNFEGINKIANEYKKMFFYQPDEENIIKTFDL